MQKVAKQMLVVILFLSQEANKNTLKAALITASSSQAQACANSLSLFLSLSLNHSLGIWS